MKVRVGLIILLMVACGYAYAQKEQAKAHDCQVAQARKELMRASAVSNIDSSRALVEDVVACARRSKSKRLLADALLEQGKLELRDDIPRDKPTRSLLESLSLYTELEDHEGVVNANLQLGVLNFVIRNIETATQYFETTIALQSENPKTRSLAFYLLALSYSELRRFDAAEEYFRKAEQTRDPTDSLFLLQLYSFKGKMLTNRGEGLKAVELLEDTRFRYQRLIEREQYSPIHSFLAGAYLQAGNFDKAIHYGRETYKRSTSGNANSIYLPVAQAALYRAYSALGELDSAFYYLSELKSLEDSIYNERTLQQITQMSGEYQFQEKLKAQQAEQKLQKELSLQEIQRQKLLRNITLIALLGAAVFAIIFFTQRIRIAKEKNRSDELLLNILPEEVAQELKAIGRTEARHYDQVSILFTDFKGFTEISSQLSPTELVAEINTCFKHFDQLVEDYDIEKIKTIGDSYMAAGGLPLASGSAVKNTVRTALAMQQFIIERHKTLIEQGRLAFKMRIGIHTGPVVAGIVGSKKFQFDVWGDTVNTASRMESTGEIGQVNISKTTYDLIKDDPDFHFNYRGKIKAKGKGEMEMWFVRMASESYTRSADHYPS